MAPKKKANNTEGVNPLDQINAYLESNKGDHYNFEEERHYVVSSGSLLLDIEMGGGIGPGVIRASGITEGGKTSCALAFGKNFQKMENAMVVYIKAEGRLSSDMIERAGIDTDKQKWFVYKSNVYESVINLMRELVGNNKSQRKYMFIIDSMDSLVPKNDLEKPPEEANKVAGGALLSTDFLRKMALGMTTRGHICYMVSQVRSKVSINPYERGDARVTNASGGNALLHFSDWILEFQERHLKDIISTQPNGKGDLLGHWCKVVFKKTPNEKTGSLVRYPIRYGGVGGKSIWVEYEVVDMLLAFDMAKKAGAWVTISDELIEEVRESTKEELKKQHQGADNLRKYFEENPKIGKYIFFKFRDTLKKS
jgi:recombination protein RecA|tara:strand:+ start:2794 stop:3894 length:1101 start_codon:yes stop_codon:yes gene_type:complete